MGRCGHAFRRVADSLISRRALALAGLGALTTLGTGCGATTVKKVTATPTSPGGTSTGPAPETAPSQTETGLAKVGSSLTLAGFEGLKMKVTVTAYLDPATGGEFATPEQGARFVGVKLSLVNVGQQAFDDAPSNGATLITNTDEQADATVTTGGSCESPSTVTIAPGDRRVVCIPFEIPTEQRGKTFQFALDSGFANQKGQWSLEGAATNGGANGAAEASPGGTGTASLPNQCSPGLAATQALSCELASNMFYEYYKAVQNGRDTTALSVWSPATKQYYTANCSKGTGVITCDISGTSDPNAQVRFTQAALDAYTPEHARAYEERADLGPRG